MSIFFMKTGVRQTNESLSYPNIYYRTCFINTILVRAARTLYVSTSLCSSVATSVAVATESNFQLQYTIPVADVQYRLLIATIYCINIYTIFSANISAFSEINGRRRPPHAFWLAASRVLPRASYCILNARRFPLLLTPYKEEYL